MDPEEINGKTLAIITVELDENGEEEGAVLIGLARCENGHLYLDREGMEPFQCPDDILTLVRPAPAELSRFFGDADFFVTMPLVPAPSEADLAESDGSDVDWQF
jgi:hypothetical protein